MLSMQGMMKKSPGPCEPPRFTRPSRKITARWYSCARSSGQGQIDPAWKPHTVNLKPVLRIRIHRIYVFLGLLDPDPLVRGMDPDPGLDPSIIKQK